eukprot:COSAG02_NODE_1977_length_10205_cov_5.317633_8_plen_55_part_00
MAYDNCVGQVSHKVLGDCTGPHLVSIVKVQLYCRTISILDLLLQPRRVCASVLQ